MTNTEHTDGTRELRVELVHDSIRDYSSHGTFKRTADGWENTSGIVFPAAESRFVARGVEIDTPSGRLDTSLHPQMPVAKGKIPIIAPGELVVPIDDHE